MGLDQVARCPAGLFLSQRKYAMDILTEAEILGCKPIDMFIEQNHYLASAASDPYASIDQYRRLVGCLVCLFVTRPELNYVVHNLAQFLSAQQVVHWEATLRYLCYISERESLSSCCFASDR